MNRFTHILRSLIPSSPLLVAALLLSGCDSNGFDDDESDALTGTWTASATVDWSRTYLLPAGGAVDSVRYLHVGTHASPST